MFNEELFNLIISKNLRYLSFSCSLVNTGLITKLGEGGGEDWDGGGEDGETELLEQPPEQLPDKPPEQPPEQLPEQPPEQLPEQPPEQQLAQLSE